jgi:ribosome-associated protein
VQNFSKKLMTRKQVSADELIAVIIKGIDDVKGENIQLLDLRDIENTVCDYFIICSGNSNTQVNAISGSVQKVVSKEIKDKPWHVEGETNAEWVLMDYVNVVVHVFQKHIRDFYDIESLWGDAKITQINPVKFN